MIAPIRNAFLNMRSDVKYALKQRLRRISKNDIYDHLTERVIRKALGRGSGCVDVGCHRGDILELMLRAAPTGYFYAFEPLPNFFAGLKKDFNQANIEIHEIALSDSDGEAQFNHVVSNPGYSGFLPRRYDRPQETEAKITVKMRRLDDIVDPRHRIDLVKIDVEGAELQVLRGATGLLKRDQPVVVFEHGKGAADFYGTGPQDVHEILVNQCGLAIWLLEDWLSGAPPLTFEAFREQFDEGLNWYFLAAPVRPRA